MRILLIVMLLAFAIVSGLRNDRYKIYNSYGMDSIALFDDSVIVDTGNGSVELMALADTSAFYDVQEAKKVIYMWEIDPTTAAADSQTFIEAILCGDSEIGYVWSNDWYSSGTMTDTITVVNTVYNRGMVEIAVDACDSIAVVTKAIATTDNIDTIFVTDRWFKFIPWR